MYRDATPLLLDSRKRSHPDPESDQSRSVPTREGWKHWPMSVITADPSRAGVERALRETRYGRCVYRVGDNDQPSSQNVSVQFANGVNASFTLHSTSYREGRETRIDGTRGSLVAGFYSSEQHAAVPDHKGGRRRDVALEPITGAHGGADPLLFRAFLAAIRGGGEPDTSARESLWSHRMAFAADRCAREGTLASWERP